MATKEVTSLSCRIFLRDDGIVETRPLPGWRGVEQLEHAESTIEAVVQVSGGVARPVLSYLSEGRITRQARRYYASVSVSTASAIVVRSPLQRVIANFLLGLNKLRIPMQVFTDEAKAVEWLRQFLPPG